jgi:hypothetical protein
MTSEEWFKTRSDEELLNEALMGSGSRAVPAEMMRRLRVAIEKADQSTTRANRWMIVLAVVGSVLAAVQALSAAVQLWSIFHQPGR